MRAQFVVLTLLLIFHVDGMLPSSSSQHIVNNMEEIQPATSSSVDNEIPDLPPRNQPKERDASVSKYADALPYKTEVFFNPINGIYPVQGLMPYAQGDQEPRVEPVPTQREGTILALWIPKHLVQPEQSFKMIFWTHKYLDEEIDVRATYYLDSQVQGHRRASGSNGDYPSTETYHRAPILDVNASFEQALQLLQEIWNDILKKAPWGKYLLPTPSLEFRDIDEPIKDILNPRERSAPKNEFPKIKAGKPITPDYKRKIAAFLSLLAQRLRQFFLEGSVEERQEEVEEVSKILTPLYARLDLVRLQIHALKALQTSQTQRNYEDFYLYLIALQYLAKYVPGKQRISLAYPDPNVHETIFGMAWYYDYNPVWSGYNVDLESEQWGAYQTGPPETSSIKKNN